MNDADRRRVLIALRKLDRTQRTQVLKPVLHKAADIHVKRLAQHIGSQVNGLGKQTALELLAAIGWKAKEVAS